MQSFTFLSFVVIIGSLLPIFIDAQKDNGWVFTSINCTQLATACNTNENCQGLRTLDPPCKNSICMCDGCGQRPDYVSDRCVSVKYANELGTPCRADSANEVWRISIPRAACIKDKVDCIMSRQGNGCTSQMKTPCAVDSDCMGERKCVSGKCFCRSQNEVFDDSVSACVPRKIGDSCSKNEECASTSMTNYLTCQSGKCACDTAASVETEITTLAPMLTVYATKKMCFVKGAKINQAKGAACSVTAEFEASSSQTATCEKSLICIRCLEESAGKCRSYAPDMVKSAESCGFKRFVYSEKAWAEKTTTPIMLIIAMSSLIFAAL